MGIIDHRLRLARKSKMQCLGTESNRVPTKLGNTSGLGLEHRLPSANEGSFGPPCSLYGRCFRRTRGKRQVSESDRPVIARYDFLQRFN
jgi:hypothetical protein